MLRALEVVLGALALASGSQPSGDSFHVSLIHALQLNLAVKFRSLRGSSQAVPMMFSYNLRLLLESIFITHFPAAAFRVWPGFPV